MKRVLKNYSKNTFKFSFRGRDIIFKAKTSKTLDMDKEEEKAEYYFWDERIGRGSGNPMIGDITDRFPEINYHYSDLLKKLSEIKRNIRYTSNTLEDTI